MRKLVTIFLILISFSGLMASDSYEVKFNQKSADVYSIEFKITDYDFRAVNLNGTDYTRLIFDGRVTTQDKGFAELPFVNANIMIDPIKNVNMEIVPISYTDYRLDFPLVPSRGVIYRNQDPQSIPYEIAPESMVDAFYPEYYANITEPYIIKDVRGITVYFYPFSYNAVTQTLRVVNEAEVVLTQVETDPVNPLYQTSGKYFPEMEKMYQSVFMNYQNNMEDLAVGEVGDILVITTARDEAAMQPYIDWKMEKGFTVHKEVVATGTNVKSLVQQKYNENNSILYVQLVGDWADIKSDQGGGANAPMDPMLGCVVGTDNFPDIAVGRFSATTPAHVTVQVDKTIHYEMNPSGDWYSNAIGIASSEGAGIGDDNESDIQHNDIIWNNRLNPFTYNTYSSAYEPGATSLMVKNYVETGASIINYTGHGSNTSWSTSGFSNTNVNQLTNGDMLPFIFSVACVNGAFHSGECFGEAWLKKEGGGAIIALMATINQPWAPPMRGQDYFNDLIIGGYNYSSNPGNGINTDEGRSIIGSIVANGLVLMYTEANSTSDLQTVQTWTTFGDAALQIRTAEPASVTLSNSVMLVGADFETTVTVDGAPFEGALVALSQDGVYAGAYSDATGMVSIPNDFLPGDVKIVVTGYNTETIYDIIQCIPPTGPYVIFNQVEVNSNSGMLEYGETSTLDFAVKNVGVEPASGVTVTISTENEFVTILDGSVNLETINPDEVLMIEDAFTLEVANNIPDGHGVQFNVVATGSETWESSFSLTAVAGVLEYNNYTISDLNGNNNGKLDPGETAMFYISILNTGGAMADDVIGELLSSDMYVTIDYSLMNYGDIPAGESAEVEFMITADDLTPAGHIANFTLNIEANKDLQATGEFFTVIGQIPVLIINKDENSNSAPQIADALTEVGISYEMTTDLPDDLNLYSSLFVCLGIFSDNSVLSQSEGEALASYLEAGGMIYMEGGDTWYYDSQTPVHSMFAINAVADGSGDLGTINGMAGTFTEGMSFNYTGDNNWIDQLEASGNGVVILSNQSPNYGTAVANNAGTYKTIGASHEFGGLAGSKSELMEAYMEFFGMMPATLVPAFSATNTEGCFGMEVEFIDNSLGATSWSWSFPGGTPESSTAQNPAVVYENPGVYSVTLEISDGTNTTQMTKNDYITVMDVPAQPDNIIGESEVGSGDIAEYHVTHMEECTLYDWVLEPAGSGVLNVDMNVVTITWSESWTGQATLMVCGGNDCGMGEYSEEFVITVMDPTGISEVDGNTLEIYPNPNTGKFNIILGSTSEANYSLKIVSPIGVDMMNKSFTVNGQYIETVDISALAEGIYYLIIKNDSQTIVEKIIVQ
jgi:PKD repeat protein